MMNNVLALEGQRYMHVLWNIFRLSTPKSKTILIRIIIADAVIFDDSVLRSVLVDVLTNIVDLVVDEDEV